MKEIIKPGYKKTAVGIIPEDWAVKRFEELANKRSDRFDPTSGINKKDIELDSLEQKSGRLLKVYCSSEYKSSKNTFKKGDILFGKLRPYLKKYWKATFDGVCSSEIWVFKNKKSILSDYLYLTIQSRYFIQKSQITSGTKMQRAEWSSVKIAKIPIPPLPEQKAIADCLSTWDRGIEKLAALIDAKKEQKKGLMQRLLTGSLRLRSATGEPFDGEWKEVRLGEIGEFKTSSVDKKIKKDEIEVWLLNYMDVYKNTHITSSIKFQKTSAKPTQLKSSNLKIGDILFTPSSETPDDIGHSAVVIEKLENVVYSYHLVRFRPKMSILELGFSGYVFNIDEILNEFSRKATGSTRYTLSIKDFNEVKTKLPPLEEQTAIAQVLTTADREIELLEKKLEAMKEQKKGLMQVLLTGKKRLRVKG